MTEMDDRYATFREHAELREQHAELRATVQQIPVALSRIETMLATRHQPDHSALAAHRALDELPKNLAQTFADALNNSGITGRSNNTSPALIAFALIGAVALGALGMQLIVGG